MMGRRGTVTVTKTAQTRTMPVASSGPLGMFFFNSNLYFLLSAILKLGHRCSEMDQAG